MITKILMASTTLLSTLSAPLLEAKEQCSSPTILILLGPPGVGKGTQAALLKEHLETPHISTGDLLRDHIQKKSTLGMQAQAYMDRGELVPDSLMIDMLFERVAQPDCQKGYILDGFPRTLVQAEAYHKRLGSSAQTVVLSLSLDQKSIVGRLSKRRTCKSCNAPFHLDYHPPKKEGVCDRCNAPLIQRSDDKEEVIQKRLSTYEAQTAPLLAYYKEKHLFKEIPSKGSSDQISKQILCALKEVYQEPALLA